MIISTQTAGLIKDNGRMVFSTVKAPSLTQTQKPNPGLVFGKMVKDFNGLIVTEMLQANIQKEYQ